MRDIIKKLVDGRDLTESEMEQSMGRILDGDAPPAQIGAFLVALRMKGETVDEIVGAAKAARNRTKKIHLNNHLINIDRDEINVEEETILDTFGTGEEGTATFNVSTATAFVAAGAGVRVVKQGTRTVSAQCWGADVLRRLGIK
ncbi:MAG: anthranilate phosphoribosyltransferase, partial [Deltaproteobacteria bacterium]|nr:anthranilate phosphoribosyltransferase [Deltaproteobacteria bacterium]